MYWQGVIAFVTTIGILSWVPGPMVMLVTSQAMVHGFANSLRTAFGVVCANAMYCFVSATAVGALLLASHKLFFTVKIVGAAYLVYLGFGLLRRASKRLVRQVTPDPHLSRRSFLSGFFAQAANPSCILFFGALLPQFMDPRENVILQVTVLAILAIVIEWPILGVYGFMADQATRLSDNPRFVVFINRAAGAVLILAAILLATQNAPEMGESAAQSSAISPAQPDWPPLQPVS